MGLSKPNYKEISVLILFYFLVLIIGNILPAFLRVSNYASLNISGVHISPGFLVGMLALLTLEIVFYLFWVRRLNLTKQELGWNVKSPGKLFLYGILALIITTPLLGLDRSNLPTILNTSFLVVLLIYLIPGPLMEEILTRGVIFAVLTRSFRPSVVILVQALVFGLMHFMVYNASGMAATFVIGLIYGFLRYKTGSLVPGIIIHIIHNAVLTISG